MGFFSKLAKGVIDTALLPIEVVKDAVTLGGVSVDKDEPFTKKRVKKVIEDLEDAYDSLDDD